MRAMHMSRHNSRRAKRQEAVPRGICSAWAGHSGYVRAPRWCTITRLQSCCHGKGLDLSRRDHLCSTRGSSVRKETQRRRLSYSRCCCQGPCPSGPWLCCAMMVVRPPPIERKVPVRFLAPILLRVAFRGAAMAWAFQMGGPTLQACATSAGLA